MQLRNSFWGSTTTISTGLLVVVGAIGRLTETPDAGDNLTGGLAMVIGALAYRLVKRRRLGLREETGFHRVAEIGLAAISLAVVLMQRSFMDQLVTNPLVNLIIPAAVLASVGIAWTGTPKSPPKSRSAQV